MQPNYDTLTRSWTYLNEQWGHSLGGVVVSGYTVDHADGVDESGYAVEHTHRVTVVERVAELLQGIQVLHVVFSLVGVVCDAPVQLLPQLQETEAKGIRVDFLGYIFIQLIPE